MITYLLLRYPRVGMLVLTALAVFFAEPLLWAASTTDIIEQFKYTYGAERVAYIASQEIVAWNILKKKMAPLGGRGQFLVPFRTKNAGVFRGHTEGGAKTTRRSQPDTAEASFSLQEFHGIFDLSWKLIQDARNSKYAFERALDFMESAYRTRVMRLLNAEVLGYGRGELGILAAADDQAAVTVRSLPLADNGLIVDLMDASDDNTKLLTGAVASAVTDIDVKNRVITTGLAAAGTAASDYFTVADSVSSSGSLHMAGLGAWISSSNPASVVGNLGGLDRSAAGFGFWQATELDNSGTLRAFTEDLGLQAEDLARERGGKKIDAYMSNLAIIRRYHESLREDVFYAGGNAPSAFGQGVGKGREGEFDGADENSTGETIYTFSGKRWHAEPYMDANRIYGLATSEFFIGHGENEVPMPISEIFDGQAGYFSETANTTFEVISYGQFELISKNPMASVAIKDIAES